MDRLPRAGELYRDVTGHVYQIAAVAVHAETGEHMVVYQAMFGDFGVYTKPLRQFLGETDYEKYPQAVQQHLFEKMERSEFQTEAGSSSERLQRSGSQLRSALAEARPGSMAEPRPWPAESATVQRAQSAENTAEPGQRSADSAAEPGQRSADSIAELGQRSADSIAESGQRSVDSIKKPGQRSADSVAEPGQQSAGKLEEQRTRHLEGMAEQSRQQGNVLERRFRPRTQSPAESRRVMRQHASETSGEGDYYYEKRRRQLEEREQRRELFRKTERHESATEELRANPCLMKFLEAETYEERFHVLNEIREDITDRLIDDIAVVLDVVIPEGELNDRFHQLQNIILTRQKYEITRLR